MHLVYGFVDVVQQYQSEQKNIRKTDIYPKG